ncbi:hypothetical protein ABB37_02073 [Leptomonas pyrrhocoris]|uniref:Uncharacterized protein n=1 Tax=Leptomonas pyrrhocoris TaxID=157538 RepID=A0A0M9G7E7_LEPPY|nr:hypothetical protein ABB37_02073 [Leptomonas pyrrhocoris]KPA83886.1 hypothetical protein ABB37_02073 [Leptomonas pyrrhocoris]|eukprot:XP_015662325.1 hypothetical protein ABB37_02073 [Leptomonas pyrrhocoris]
MKQINVETATREQLVDFIRRMHPQLQREQERVRELESQVSGFQEFIHEKNAEIRELRQQSDRLTEKSASDEETIGALIKQMEAMRQEQTPSPNMIPITGAFSASTLRARSVEQGSGKGHPSGDGAAHERSPESIRSPDSSGNGEAARRPSRTPPPLKENLESVLAQLKSQSATAATTISGRTEEIAKLENKVRELMEINAFYSAIVAQHDQEEKARLGQKLVLGSGQLEEEVAELRQEVERLQLHISNMDVQEEKLQRVTKATEAEKSALRIENELLKKEAVQLEAEMAEMTREHARARRSLAAAASHQSSTIDVRLTYADTDGPQARAVSAPQQISSQDALQRVPLTSMDSYTQQPERRYASLPGFTASRVSPLSHEGRQGMMRGSGASPVAATNLSSASHSRFNFRSLRPIRVRNPDAHERDLLDRIHIYEEQLTQMELFEADRQRSFDEMERNRAEMFAAMNVQLERQRKEIHRLRKLHEDVSLDSSFTARPSHNQSVGSVVNREEEEGQASLRRHGSHSPVERCLTAVPTSTQSLLNVESYKCVDEVDGVAGASVNGRDSLALRSAHQRRLAPSATHVGVSSPEEEFRWHEKEERLLVWRAAMESAVQLAAGFHAITVQSYTKELTACHAKLLGERAALTSELEELQLHNEKLEAQVANLEVELHRSSEAAEADRTAQTNPEVVDQKVPADEDVFKYLLEQKALCAAHLAMDMYGGLVTSCCAFLHEMENHSLGAEVYEGFVDLTEEVARDLAEVHAALHSLTQQQREVPQESHVMLSATPSILVDPSTPQSPPTSYVDVASADIPEHSDNDKNAAQGFRSSSSIASSPIHCSSPGEPAALVADQRIPITATTTTGSTSVSTASAKQVNTESPFSANTFRGDATAVSISQDDSRRSSFDSEAEACNEDKTQRQSEDRTASTEGDSPDDSEGEALAQVSAEETDGTAPSQFADCVEKDDGTGRTSVTPEGAERMASVCTMSDEGSDVEGHGGAVLAASVSSEREESDEREGGNAQAPLKEVSPNVTTYSSTRADADVKGGAQVYSQGSVVELRESDTMSATSQLEMTETEEAEFLAQLQKAMGEDGATGWTVPEEGEKTAQAALASTSLSSSRTGKEEGEEIAEVESHHFGESSEGELDGRAAATASATSSTATSEEQKPDGRAALNSPEGKASSSCTDSVHQAKAEVDATTSSNMEVVKSDVPFPPGSNREDAGDGPELSFSNSSADVSAVAPSPHFPSNGVAQEGEGSVSAVTEGLKAAAAVVAPLPPAAATPPLIPPTSLDELFGGYPGTTPFPPPPADVPPRVFKSPAVSYATSPPPSAFPERNKPVDSCATFSNHASLPTLSPSSMFATPPRPAPSRTFFIGSPHDGSYAPPQSSPKGASTRGSSSSDDVFEAGFDPFA